MIRIKLKEVISNFEFKQKRRLQIKEISEQTGINRMTLSKILNRFDDASITTRNLDKLCDFFDCIEPEVSNFKTFEFHKYKKIIQSSRL